MHSSRVGLDVYRRKRHRGAQWDVWLLVLARVRKDHGGFKKLMWYGIMKEFNCTATSTRSKCGRHKETAFTHRQLGERRQEWKAQLDYIIGRKGKSHEAYIYNDVKIWDGWDHYPTYATIQEDEIAKNFPARRRRKKWTGWRPKTDERTIEFQKEVMRS